jgi:hypothetical protein
MLKRVVLPAPFGPMTPIVFPDGTDSETSSSATRPPKRALTLRSTKPVALPASGEVGVGEGGVTVTSLL